MVTSYRYDSFYCRGSTSHFSVFQISTKSDSDLRFEYSKKSSDTIISLAALNPRNFLLHRGSGNQPDAGGVPNIRVSYKGELVQAFDWVRKLHHVLVPLN